MAIEPLSKEDEAERLRTILNSARDGIIALDPDGCIDGVNPAIEQMFGYLEAELVGKGIGRLYENTPTDDQVQGYLAYVRNKNAVTSYSKFPGKRKNGTSLLCEVAVTPMRLSNGVHYVSIVRDITERQRIEEMKDQFVATVSHELRTPLTSISGSLGLLVGGAVGELPAKALRLVKIAHSNSERLVRLVNDILDIEKIESGKMAFDIRPVRLAALIRQSLEGVAGFAEQYGVQVELACHCEDATVQGDPDRLMQVMTNLLSNAIKFSPRGETVAIDIDPADRAFRVSVKNRGKGIPDDFRDRIFSRFAQADGSSTRERGGTGLGLNIVQEIVTRLGGDVGFDSSPGEGATFYFSLPASSPSGAQEEVLICTAGGDFTGDSRALAELGVPVRFARTVDELRELIATNAFSAVILDLRLAGAYRDEAVQIIQRHAQNSPLIILAGEPGRSGARLPLRALLEWLERAAPETEARAAAQLTVQPSEGRILHVEDDEDILSLVANAFGPRTEIMAARTLLEGLDIIRKHRLDAVILDIDLGDECGLELLPSIRQLHPAVPVVIFSASDAEASAGVPVDAVLTKSRVSLDEVVSTVRVFVRSRKGAVDEFDMLKQASPAFSGISAT